MYEDSADSCVFENLFSILFAGHPIRNSIAGTVESIQNITEQTLYDCHRAFYTPANMMLCVVGDVDPQMIFDVAETQVPAGRPAVAERDYGPPEEMRPAKTFLEREMEVSMPTFGIGFKTEPVPKGRESMEQEAVGGLAAEILAGESSPLYARLYTRGLIDSDFSAGYEGLKGVSMLTAGGDSKSPRAVCDAILEEALRIQREGVDSRLFERLKRSALGRRMRDLDSFESICYRMCAYHFEGVDYFDFPGIYNSVNEDQVTAFLRRTVTEERLALSVIRPNEKGGRVC